MCALGHGRGGGGGGGGSQVMESMCFEQPFLCSCSAGSPQRDLWAHGAGWDLLNLEVHLSGSLFNLHE